MIQDFLPVIFRIHGQLARGGKCVCCYCSTNQEEDQPGGAVLLSG
jgi:hypothetical protein